MADMLRFDNRIEAVRSAGARVEDVVAVGLTPAKLTVRRPEAGRDARVLPTIHRRIIWRGVRRRIVRADGPLLTAPRR